MLYPVAVDSNLAIWRAFKNSYWPPHYFVDAKGRIRHHHFGEGEYDVSEQVIQELLTEANPGLRFDGLPSVAGTGVEASATNQDQSPETYIGFERAEGNVSKPSVIPNRLASYHAQPAALNQWGLDGRWTVGPEQARLDAPGGRIVYRFQARDLHLVLGPGVQGRPVRFRITIDGKAPGADHGVDVDEAGDGIVTSQRLHQLVRLKGPPWQRVFTIEFLDAGVDAYSFTFG